MKTRTALTVVVGVALIAALIVAVAVFGLPKSNTVNATFVTLNGTPKAGQLAYITVKVTSQTSAELPTVVNATVVYMVKNAQDVKTLTDLRVGQALTLTTRGNTADAIKVK